MVRRAACDGALDPRSSRVGQALVAEIAFASGMSAFPNSFFGWIAGYDKKATVEECIDVGPVPGPILRAAAELPRDTIDIPKQMPAGVMNAPFLLAELQDRSAKYQPGAENHVINFTLLPLTDVDAEVLTGVLGQIPLVIRSGGYGSSRVFATGLRHVWAVQYVNGMGNVILDTLEVGGIPVSVLAAKEDFEDSAERLAEILMAFTS